MTKLNLKSASAALALITGIFLYAVSGYVSAEMVSPDIINGKVQYADDHTPVTNGTVKVMMFNNSTRTYNVLETINIEQNGTFKVNRNLILTTDEIRIMAYPNDVDNNGNPFEPTEFDLQKFDLTENENFDILIEVERIANIKSGKIGKVITPGNTNFKKTESIEKINLEQNYPNPFNPTTVIRFELPESKNVSLTVYNMKGEAVAILAENKVLQKGYNEFEFYAGELPSGVYVYTLKAGNFTENRKMTLLK